VGTTASPPPDDSPRERSELGRCHARAVPVAIGVSRTAPAGRPGKAGSWMFGTRAVLERDGIGCRLVANEEYPPGENDACRRADEVDHPVENRGLRSRLVGPRRWTSTPAGGGDYLRIYNGFCCESGRQPATAAMSSPNAPRPAGSGPSRWLFEPPPATPWRRDGRSNWSCLALLCSFAIRSPGPRLSCPHGGYGDFPDNPGPGQSDMAQSVRPASRPRASELPILAQGPRHRGPDLRASPVSTVSLA